jgi:DNA-binding transcriptional regulator YiaG
MELPANRIEELRGAKELTRVEIAVACEVGEMTIRRWERGESLIPDPQKFRLAELFDCSPAHVMGWDRADSKAAA